MSNTGSCVIVSIGSSQLIYQLLVFSVTPLKIDQNKNQNRSIDKVQNLENERRYMYKDPRQDSVRGISKISEEMFYPNFIEICMETPCWCSPG